MARLNFHQEEVRGAQDDFDFKEVLVRVFVEIEEQLNRIDAETARLRQRIQELEEALP